MFSRKFKIINFNMFIFIYMDRINKILDFVNNNVADGNYNDFPGNEGNNNTEDNKSISKNIMKNNEIRVEPSTEPNANVQTNEDNKENNEPIEPIATSDEKVNENVNDEIKNTNKYIDIVKDTKRYNSLRRKLNKQKIYPCNIDGYAFYKQEDVNNFIVELANNKKAYNKQLKADKLNKTKLNIDNLENINESNEYIEQDGYIYANTNPVGVVKDNKRYKLPATNKKDRAEIFNEVKDNKEVINKLLKAETSDDFDNITIENIKNNNVKDKAIKHINNDIKRDNTWNKNEFLKLMEQMMQANEEKITRTNIPQPIYTQRPSTPYIQHNEGYNIPNGLNPQLFRKF